MPDSAAPYSRSPRASTSVGDAITVGSDAAIARTPSSASAEVIGLHPGAHSASTEWASALNADGPVTKPGRPSVSSGSYTTTRGSTTGSLPVCLCWPPVRP